MGGPDLLVPGADESLRSHTTAGASPCRWSEDFTLRAIGTDVSEGAVAFDWFDSSTFPVHKGLPPFGSCL